MLIHWEAAPGTSLPEMNRITGWSVQELGPIPGVRNVGAHVGRAITSDQSADVNAGEIWVSLDPASQLRRPSPPSRRWSTAIPASIGRS